MTSRWIRVALPLAVLLLGALICAGLLALRPRSGKTRPERQAPLVEVLQVQLVQLPAQVRASGVVEPARQLTLSPEVGGRVVRTAPDLLPGARFAAGELLVALDARDYRLAIEQQQSALRQAELELELELGRQRTALREWELLGDGRDASEAALALRAPHLASAEAALEAARAGLEKARLDLERTTLRAPFNVVVADEQVEQGQVVSPGSPLATLYGSDRFLVNLSLPLERLALVDVPGFNAQQGSPALVVQRLGEATQAERSGRVLGLAGELDAEARTARLLVAVERPLEVTDGDLPLLPGAFVEVWLTGRGQQGVAVVPREAVFDGEGAWVLDDEDRLARRRLQLSWSDAEQVYATTGLTEGERLVLTPPPLAVEGMQVRVAGGGS